MDQNRNQLEKSTSRSIFENFILQSIRQSLENVNTEGA